MIFYKVKPEADQVRYNNPLNGWHLIANELFTEKEMSKMNFSSTQISSYFDKTEISKFNTHWFFGARFKNV